MSSDEIFTQRAKHEVYTHVKILPLKHCYSTNQNACVIVCVGLQTCMFASMCVCVCVCVCACVCIYYLFSQIGTTKAKHAKCWAEISADNILKDFFLIFFPEKRNWHFIQTVSKGQFAWTVKA